MKGQSLFIKPTAKAPRYVSRRHPQSPFANVAYNTDAPPDPAEDKRTESDLLNKIQGLINQSLANRATKEELETIIANQNKDLKDLPIAELRALADMEKGAMAILARQGLEIQRMNKAIQLNKTEDMSLRGQIKSWLSSTAEGSTTKVSDIVKDIRSGIKRDLPPLEIRAVASPMGVSTVNPTSSPFIGRVEVAPGINDFIRLQPTFWDFLTKGRTNAPTYVWVNKTNPQGAAAFIGPGVAKPGVSFDLTPEFSNAKKIADSAKATTELLEDIDGMATFIEQELRYQVMIKVNNTLINSVGSSTVPTGIRQLSTTFTETGLATTNPNHIDALRAVVAQLRNGLLTGEITIFINPIDAANMDMDKAVSSGVYLLPPFTTNDRRVISGATIVEDHNITVGSFQAGFMRYYRILIYKDFTISWGWENDDFTKNLVTVVGEMRLHQFMNSIHTGAFIYDTFANVIAGITA